MKRDGAYPYLEVNKEILKEFELLDGIQLIVNVINRMIEICRVVKERHQLIRVEMSIKVALNILYVSLLNLKDETLSKLLENIDIEDVIMKLIQASLEINFIPIRKVVILFHMILKNKFGNSKPLTITDVKDLKDNIIVMSMLQA